MRTEAVMSYQTEALALHLNIPLALAALLLAATVAHRVYRGLREAEDLDWH